MGGIRSISTVASRLVSLVAAVYVAGCLTVILVNITHVPAAIGEVLSGAFAPEGVAGDVLGALIVGFQRALFSSEAGIGSAVITTRP